MEFRGIARRFPPNALISIITVFVVPAGLAGLTVLGMRIAATRPGLDALPEVDRFLLLLAAMLPATILLIVASRCLFDQPYPELRTAVYWIPLLSLAGLCCIRRLTRPFGIAAAAVIGLCILQYCTQFNTRYFAEWQYCAAGKDMMRIVRDEHAARPGTRVRLGVTWQLEPVVNFYRVAWRLDWMDPVYRESPNGSFDYYALAYDDVALVDQLHLKALLRDRLSGTALARRVDF